MNFLPLFVYMHRWTYGRHRVTLRPKFLKKKTPTKANILSNALSTQNIISTLPTIFANLSPIILNHWAINLLLPHFSSNIILFIRMQVVGFNWITCSFVLISDSFVQVFRVIHLAIFSGRAIFIYSCYFVFGQDNVQSCSKQQEPAQKIHEWGIWKMKYVTK